MHDHQRTYRGLTIGPDTAIDLREERGVDDIAVASGDVRMARYDGSFPGRDTVDPKEIEITLEVVGPRIQSQGTIDQVLAAFGRLNEPARYLYKNPGHGERFIWASPITRVTPRTAQSDAGATGITTIDIVMLAHDPRIYSVTEHQAVVPPFGQSGDGVDWSVDWPLDIDAPVPQLADIIHDGALGGEPAWPLIRFFYPPSETGTCDGVRLTNLSTGAVAEFAANDLLTPGQTLVADMEAAVTGRGVPVSISSAALPGYWVEPQVPLGLQKGLNKLRFDIDGTADIECSVRWRTTDL